MNRAIAVGIVAVTIVGVAAVFALSGPAIEQPLAFNHSLHVEEFGAYCTDCHLYAETGIRATIPPLAVCADCHDEALGESEAEAWLVERIAADEPIGWQKLYSVEDHIFFSHRRHTTVGEIECAECHGDMASLTEPPPRPLVPISMDTCMDCHYERDVANGCISCHW